MSKKQKVFVMIAFTFVVIFIIAGFFQKQKTNKKYEKPASAGDQKNLTENPQDIIPPGSVFVKDVPKNAVETKPVEEIKLEGASRQGESLGIYSISANSNGYTPQSLIIQENVIITLGLTSIDGDYDIYSPGIGFYAYAPKGTTVQTSFRTIETGSYLFQCRDHCPHGKIIKGVMVVKPK